MKTTAALLLVATVLGPCVVRAEAGSEFQRVLAKAAEAEQRHDTDAALALYRQAATLRPDDAFVLQKMAQQISDSFFLEPDAPQQRERVEEAMRYARRAVEIDPLSAVNQLSVGVLYGRLVPFVKPSQKVEYARLVREYAERAAALDPGYAWAQHTLGRWHMEMASIGAAKRAFVALFAGSLPAGSKDEAVEHLEQAVALEPEAIAHRVELGFAYANVGRTDDARRVWEDALSRPPRAIHDGLAQERAREGLGRLTKR